jgi:hypothetical protein
MRRVNLPLLWAALLILAIPCFASERCSAKPTILMPAAKEQRQEFIQWIKSNPKLLEATSLAPDNLDNYPTYLADINNDGKPEVVIVTSQGSLGFMGLYVFSKVNKGKFQYLDDALPRPSNNTQDGPWYTHEYWNQLTDKSELLVQLCGKTYVSFNEGTHQDPMREVYIWEGGKTHKACTPEWSRVHRDFFKKLYDIGKFEAAYSYLSGILKSCNAAISPANRLWMKNDVALAAFKKGDPETCKTNIQEIKSDPAFKTATKSLVSAVSFNAGLCTGQAAIDQQQGNTGKYDYSWLLSFDEALYWDKNFDGLLSAVVPNAKSATSESTENLKVNLKMALSLMDNKKIIENRYVLFSGCMAHNCGEKGMIWIDVKAAQSAMAIGDIAGDSDASVVVASRSMTKNNLPKEFILEVKNWANEKKLGLDHVTFYDYSGKSDDITGLFN